MFHLLEQDQGVRALLAELLDHAGDPPGDEVVPQVHDEVGATQEVPGGLHCVGQAQRPCLGDVGDPRPETTTIADRFADLVGGVADHDPDLRHPRLDQGLQTIEEDGLVGDGNQLLGSGVGDRAQPGALSPAQDQPFHCDQGYQSLRPSPLARASSVGVAVEEESPGGEQQDLEVEAQRPVLDVIDVVEDALFDAAGLA